MWGAGLALGLACALPAGAEAQIGILAGYNRDTLAEFLPENGFDLTELTDGYHVGVFLNFNLATFSLRPAVIYHRMPELVAMAGEERVRFDIDLVEIPLDFRIRLPLPAVQPYVLGGPVLTFPSSTFSGVDDLLTARPVRAEFGVGVELDLGFRLWPEVRYGFGLGSLMGSDVAVGSRVLQGEGEPRHDSLTLRLGISF
ncbi:MAG: PorT family protein [Gemmatimonadales bacterium]|nr:PorT family protein [Gemmatimonadales bacterium]MYG18870.1 PorT family protein [Gemmatimonadales bacterium]MYH09278.1 PorT family protein [Gemmatimonadales bacterium]MYL07866.1 PorT family protein [Gemmatimonadales bacterium]